MAPVTPPSFLQGDVIKKTNGPTEPATDTTAPTNIDLDSKRLDSVWLKIETGLTQEAEGRKLWIEGTLELSHILDNARKRLGSDQAFGTWLTDNGYGETRITRHDRSALLNMALDLHVTREVLAQTHRRSWRLIWEEEMQPRLPSGGQPGGNDDPEKKTRRGKKKRAKTPASEPEWLRDTRGWFGALIERECSQGELQTRAT